MEVIKGEVLVDQLSKSEKRKHSTGRPKIKGRMSSLAAVFVQAIIPRKVDANAQTELYKRFGINPDECVYCGSERTDADHLRPIVKAKQSSGYFHTAENLVPACGTCNQSKSGADWRKWMKGNAAKSPATRNVSGLPERIARLAAFAKVAQKPIIAPEEMRDVVGAELWDRYWRRLAEIEGLMAKAQDDADKISPILEDEFEKRLSAAVVVHTIQPARGLNVVQRTVIECAIESQITDPLGLERRES